MKSQLIKSERQQRFLNNYKMLVILSISFSKLGKVSTLICKIDIGFWLYCYCIVCLIYFLWFLYFLTPISFSVIGGSNLSNLIHAYRQDGIWTSQLCLLISQVILASLFDSYLSRPYLKICETHQVYYIPKNPIKKELST